MPPPRLTNEECDARLQGRGITRLDDIQTVKIKIRFKCDNGHIWKARPNDILQGTNCPCSKCRVRVTNEVIDKSLIGRNIIRLDNSKGTGVRIRWQCTIDGYIWITTPHAIMRGTGCSVCSKRIKLTNEIVDERLVGRNITRLGKICGANSPCKWKCDIDGHIWTSTPGHILHGSGCPRCGKILPLTPEDIQSRMAGMKDRHITLLSDYVDSATKIKCRCDIDGHIWETMPGDLWGGHGCPRCNTSVGEKAITIWLTTHNIHHVHQKRFATCRYINTLPFDFYLPDHNILIEFQGIQHFKPIKLFGGVHNLKVTQCRDIIKKKWARKNGIKLIYVTYRHIHKNIDKLLEQHIL